MAIGQILLHLFIPHHTNNHRAKVLHIDALLTYVLLFAIINFVLHIGHTQMPDVLGYATDIHVEQLLADTNAQRASLGLPTLQLNSQLSEAAARKAADMFSKNYWAHNSPEGATPWEFISASGYAYAVAGENLAKNFSNSQGVVDAWMASPTHRANMVKPTYRDIGFAVVNGVLNGEETTLVVQMFGATNGELAAAAPTPAPQAVEVGAASAATEEAAVVPVASSPAVAEQPAVFGFTDVIKTPMINIPTATRTMVFVFVGILMGVLVVDAWVVSRKNIMRLAGHNLAHFLFLSALLIITTFASRGSLL